MEHEMTLTQAIYAMLFSAMFFLVAAAICTLEQASY